MYQPINETTRFGSYLIFPRSLLQQEMTATELNVYMLLLDRCRLSARSEEWRDGEGNAFLYFPVLELAEKLGRSATAIKKAMGKLEEKGLIRRKRQGLGKPNRIYVSLPPEDGGNASQEGWDVASPEGWDSASPEGNEACPRRSDPLSRRRETLASHKTATTLPPNNNYRDKTTELKEGSKHAFGILHNLTLTAGEAREVSLLPEGEKHADKVALYLAGGWKFPDPMGAIRKLAQGASMEDMLLSWPYTKQSPEPSPERPPSYP